jgi:hypothetical protein
MMMTEAGATFVQGTDATPLAVGSASMTGSSGGQRAPWDAPFDRSAAAAARRALLPNHIDLAMRVQSAEGRGSPSLTDEPEGASLSFGQWLHTVARCD